MRINDFSKIGSLDELVLFSFDSEAFPFQKGLQLKLIPFPSKLDAKIYPVVPLGNKGEHDSGAISYYGTVCKVEDEYWMWYLANDDSGGWLLRLCLAKSNDGKNWTKPDLGVCEYNGSKHNNLCDFPIGSHIQACVIIYDENETDKKKVFKMSYESPKYNKSMGVAFSPDGIHWTEYPGNPVINVFYEQGGGMKWGDTYYMAGQGNVSHYSPKGSRCLATYCSKDFINWTPAACIGFRRDPIPPRTVEYGGINGPQVHLGAGLWNRGNVIIGFYGMWNGHVTNDRNFTAMHIGLIITHDGLHYYEPIPDFPIVLGSEIKDNTPSRGRYPALMQGQGCYNIGDETLFWFGLWPESDSNGVRAARWERDRLGYLTPFVGPKDVSTIISSEIDTENKSVRLAVNVNGLGEYSKLRVSVLDNNYCPLPGYGPGDASVISENGLKVSVSWKDFETIRSEKPIRLKIDFEGIRPEDIEFYAAYLKS
jgi:hypothetical protein